MRIILHQGRRKCTQEMHNELKLLTLNSRRRFLRFISIFIILHNLDCPDQSRDTIKFRCNMHEKDMRDYKTLLDLPKVTSIISFKRIIYMHLLEIDNNSHICSL